jgi:RNA polymerase sigma-70 factor (ECF subfamily)
MSEQEYKHNTESAVDELFRSGLEDWPDFDCREEELRDYLRARVQDEGESLDGGELRLAWACATGLSEAVQVFEDRYLRKARLALKRLQLREEERDEVLSKVRERLLLSKPGEQARLLQYAGLGTLEGLVVVSCTREALSLLRKRKDLHLTENSPRLVDSKDPQGVLLKAELTKEMRASFEVAVGSLTPRQRNLLRLSLVDKLSIDEIGLMHRVHRATAARWLAEARDQLTDRSREAVLSALEIDSDELAGVIELVESQLSLSLPRLLQSAPETSKSLDT